MITLYSICHSFMGCLVQHSPDDFERTYDLHYLIIKKAIKHSLRFRQLFDAAPRTVYETSAMRQHTSWSSWFLFSEIHGKAFELFGHARPDNSCFYYPFRFLSLSQPKRRSTEAEVGWWRNILTSRTKLQVWTIRTIVVGNYSMVMLVMQARVSLSPASLLLSFTQCAI